MHGGIDCILLQREIPETSIHKTSDFGVTDQMNALESCIKGSMLPHIVHSCESSISSVSLWSPFTRAAMQVLQVLCGVAEYDELPVRHNEDKINTTLAGEVRWPTPARSADDPHIKANLLLQVIASVAAQSSRKEGPVYEVGHDHGSLQTQHLSFVTAQGLLR